MEKGESRTLNCKVRQKDSHSIIACILTCNLNENYKLDKMIK